MIKLFKNLNKKEILLIFVAMLLIFSQVWLELKMPDYMSQITILVQSEGSKMKDILKNGGFMLLCALGSLLSAVITSYITTKVSAVFSKRVRKSIFDKVENLSMHEVKSFSISSLITRTTNDVSHVEMFISMGMQLLLKAPITAVWAIIKIVNKNFTWSMLTGAAVMILLIFVIILISLVVPKFSIIQSLTDKLNRITRENLNGIRVVRAFNAEKYQENKFDEANKDLTSVHLFTQKSFAFMQPIMYLVMQGLALAIYYVGAFLIDRAIIADKLLLFGDMVVFSSYAMQVIMSFLMLTFIFMILPRANISAKRINEILEAKISVVDGKIDKDITGLKGIVEFRNVSFKYPDADEYLLKNINFKVDKGQTIAFIGSTGSGKSTLINLVPRFYDATDGQILVDGINVKDYKQEFLYSKLGYVSQKAVLFSGSVKSNVKYGKSIERITDKKVEEAIEIAQASEFVLKMDNKYDSHIASRGTNISGGQKQRLSIARAIARNPEIYIFDDSFSALDYKTDSILRKSLKKYTKDATILIVAQRIGTIMNADKIVVLDKGEIVGIGTHSQLLKNCEVYKEIAYSQLSKEELENA